MEKGTTTDNKPKKRTKPSKHLPQPNIVHQLKKLVSNERDLTEIVCLTSYPPRECGIATYSKDLERALTDTFGEAFKLTTVPLESGTSKHRYPEVIAETLNTDSALDFLQAAYRINADRKVGLVMIQHEFGLFQNNGHSFHEFLEYLDKPVVVTFHTVLPDPTPELKQKVSTIASRSAAIIVMTRTSADVLTKQYDISPDKISVVAHGTHLIEYEDKDNLKERYGLEGRTVLSTFGLLGPGKSIETSLDALPEIIDRHPEVIFLIIGKTHPTLVKEKGEGYRHFLEEKVETLGLVDHIRFIDEFVPLDDLLEYLQLTDIYLFTSKDRNQAVSGTFAYALGCGCPVISTPIPHALEVLQNGAGVLFDFEDSHQLQHAVIDLLEDDKARAKMSLDGMRTASATAWENSAIAHARIFENVLQGSLPLQYKKPPIDLKHLKRMTTDMGVIQFSKINHPDIESGYTLDDNARALVAMCQHYELTGNGADLPYIKTYFDFVFSCFRPDGTFLNYVDKEQRFTDQNGSVNLEDACGRALWALGYLLSISDRFPGKYQHIIEKAKFVFQHALQAVDDFRSPRATAFIIKGLYFYNQSEGRECINTVVEKYADRLKAQYDSESDEDWHWFEGYLTYGNSVLPQSMLMAYVMTLHPGYRKVAKRSFDFLLSKIFDGDMIRVISNRDWHMRDAKLDDGFQGGEQPIDVAYTILALRLFHKIFPQEGYDTLMETAFAWFLGKNPLHQTIYNPCTGGCYDGLERHNVNLNQGAESTISYLLARMAFENFDLS
ncbi:glycosyltransferase [Pricia sp.]|uniref:glycosyltransferase n=1 Tax=Pricia sp. TaxID=2268138 RepID=UPI0035943D89